MKEPALSRLKLAMLWIEGFAEVKCACCLGAV